MYCKMRLVLFCALIVLFQGVRSKESSATKLFRNMTAKINVTQINQNILEVGTRISFDKDKNALFYVDVTTGNGYKFDLNTSETNQAKITEEPLAFMFPVEGEPNKFIAGIGRKLCYVTWDGKCKNAQKVELIKELEWEEPVKDNRLNGAKVDPYGRLWAGTMGPGCKDGTTKPGQGSLYSFSKGTLLKHETNIGISNGLAWDTKLNKMYYIDTLFPGVYQYDYNPQNGTISNKDVCFDFEKYNISGLPDGLTIDTDGNLLVACIHGSTIVHFNPRTGYIINILPMPTPQVTSLTFGGDSLNKIYVTTAKMADASGVIPPEPAGGTFVIEGYGVTGTGDTKYKQ